MRKQRDGVHPLATGIVFVLVVIFVVGCSALGWWAFQALWNALVPKLFHGPTLTYWQAAGISTLGGVIGGWFRSQYSSGSK